MLGIYKMHVKKNWYWKFSLKLLLEQFGQIETKNILIGEKYYKDPAIYFTRCVQSKSIKMLNLHYYELMGKIEEHEGKKYLMIDDYMLDEVLDRINELINIEKFDDTKISVGEDDKLPDQITFS